MFTLHLFYSHTSSIFSPAVPDSVLLLLFWKWQHPDEVQQIEGFFSASWRFSDSNVGLFSLKTGSWRTVFWDCEICQNSKIDFCPRNTETSEINRCVNKNLINVKYKIYYWHLDSLFFINLFYIQVYLWKTLMTKKNLSLKIKVIWKFMSFSLILYIINVEKLWWKNWIT